MNADNETMARLDDVAERIRADFSAQDDVRDDALRQSREVIRLCATAIRSVHRDEREKARDIMGQAVAMAPQMVKALEPHPGLLYAGYFSPAALRTKVGEYRTDFGQHSRIFHEGRVWESRVGIQSD